MSATARLENPTENMGDNRKENTMRKTMQTPDSFTMNGTDALRKVLRKFTVTDEGADGMGTLSNLSTEFSYNGNSEYSVVVDETRDEENCHGILFVTLYYTNPEWGVCIAAENECRYNGMSERTEILARELVECVGIIETQLME